MKRAQAAQQSLVPLPSPFYTLFGAVEFPKMF
jgi:hypothetical protein